MRALSAVPGRPTGDVVVYANICSMESWPSQDPRDVLARAAMNDAATLGGMFVDEFEAAMGARLGRTPDAVVWMWNDAESHLRGAASSAASQRLIDFLNDRRY